MQVIDQHAKIPSDASRDFNDSFFRDLCEPKSGDGYVLSPSEQNKFDGASVEVANQLMRMHDIKPFDRKKWVSNKFSGRGMLSVLDIIMESILSGRMTLMEKRRRPINPDKPSVGMMMDVSGSMSHSKVFRSAALLGASLCEFFRGGFAKDFAYATIGNSSSTFVANMNLAEAKRTIIATEYDEGNTLFSPPINQFERHSWFDGRNTKYLFIITDGTPENNGVDIKLSHAGASNNPSWKYNNGGTGAEIDKMIAYIRERWAKDDRLEYFWIQLGSNSQTFLNWIANMGFLPTRDEAKVKFDVNEYDRLSRNFSARPTSPWGKWASFMWDQYKVGNIFFTNVDQMIQGVAFHKMLDYFLLKFRKRIK